jgi:hypothetical protein
MFLLPFVCWLVFIYDFDGSTNAMWIIRSVTLFVSMVYLGFCVMYVFFASQNATESWVMQIGTPLCGQSSCSSTIEDDTHPYRPESHGPLTELDVNNAVRHRYFHYCPSPHCRWAGSTGNNTIQGYMNDLLTPCSGPSCDNYATTNVSDYPNKGVGLSQGYFLGSVVTETRLCEGVNPVHRVDELPRGRMVCSTCAGAFYHHKFITNLDGCDDSGGSYLCFVCPGYFQGEYTDFETLRNISSYFLFTSIWLFLLFLYILLPSSWSLSREKGKERRQQRTLLNTSSTPSLPRIL